MKRLKSKLNVVDKNINVHFLTKQIQSLNEKLDCLGTKEKLIYSLRLQVIRVDRINREHFKDKWQVSNRYCWRIQRYLFCTIYTGLFGLVSYWKKQTWSSNQQVSVPNRRQWAYKQLVVKKARPTVNLTCPWVCAVLTSICAGQWQQPY